MSAGPPFRLEGADALYAAFRELPKATKRNVLYRVLKDVIKPLADAVTAKAPRLTGNLKLRLVTGPTSKLNKRQRRMEKYGAGAFEAAIHFGTDDPAGMMNEFGNAHMNADPFFRQEWEGRKYAMVDDIAKRLGPQIEAAGARMAKKLKGK